MTTIAQPLTGSALAERARSLLGERGLRRIALGAIVLLAAVLRFANLSALGYANHYYTAAVVSMLQSWSNFFFAAAEPGGAVTVDKPPVGLWLQAASAYLFGVNGFSVLLPQIVAGILSVVVVYHLVRRSFGAGAGLLAALALAITPISVATDRNNTIDSTLILTLLLAAWAFIKAAESARLRWLLFGATLVGVGFNIKMLQAYLPLPAFFALYVFGAAERLWRKIAKLLLAAAVLLIVSFSWAVTVDLIPEDQRPFIGSSGDNSVTSLILGYNGVQRLLGMGGRGFLTNLFGGNNNPGGFQPPQDGARGNIPQQVPNRDGFPQGQAPQAGGPRGAGPGGGGFPGTGQAGAQRLFVAPLSKEASWLLPFALAGMLLLLVGARPRWTVAPKHQALLLWGGWLLVAGGFFSVAGFFHEYYLSTLAPPLAALVGIAAAELWAIRKRNAALAAILLIGAAGVTLWLQYNTAIAYVRPIGWLPLVAALAALGVLALCVSALFRRERLAMASFAFVIAALLVTPGVWSWLTMTNSSSNQSLPAAYSGGVSGPANRGDVQVNQSLLAFLQTNTRDNEYLMAVPSSMQGADYVIATGRPVLYLGGFNGNDQVLTASELAQMVAAGELRYIYWGGQGGPGGPGGFGAGQLSISSWVSRNCTAVTGYDTQTQNAGAPDGTTPGGGFGNLRVSLYDCAKAK